MLIEANDLYGNVDALEKNASKCFPDYICGIHAAKLEIARAHVVDPVKHGHWIIENSGYVSCSICRCDTNVEDKYGYPIGRNDLEDTAPAFCPHCGARMDGEV